jgi:hypothetical protein
MTIKVITAAKTPNGAAKPGACPMFIDQYDGPARTPVTK